MFTAYRLFQSVGMAVINENYFHGEVNNRIYSGNNDCHSAVYSLFVTLKCVKEMCEHYFRWVRDLNSYFSEGWLKMLEAESWIEYLDLRETCKDFRE